MLAVLGQERCTGLMSAWPEKGSTLRGIMQLDRSKSDIWVDRKRGKQDSTDR